MIKPFASERKPQVLHIISGLDTGGAEMMLRKLVTWASRYEHVVVSLRGLGMIGPDLRKAGIRVEALDLSTASGAIFGVGRLAGILRRLRPNVIQGWMSHGNLVATTARRLGSGRTPLIWNIRQSFRDPRFDKRRTRLIISLNARLSGAPERIIYNSLTGAEQHEAIGYDRSKRRIIPNGFDIEQFVPCESVRAATRQDLGVADDEILVGMIARFHPIKNHAALFEAVAHLYQVAPRLRLLTAGRGMTADNPQLRALIPEAIRDKCLLLGSRSEIPQITAALDLACNVSVSEGFPNVVGEAMACAVPCIVTPSGDSPSVVGDTGVVCKSASADHIADALAQMLSIGVEGRQRLGRAARARVEEKFSLKAIIEQYEALYDEVLETPATAIQ